MITGLDHIAIATPRLEETRLFFVEVLGLREGSRPEVAVPGYWLYAGDRAIVHLFGLEEGRSQAAAALDHFALQLSHLEDMKRRLEEHHVPYREFALPGSGRVQLLTKEPNGVTVELNFRVAI
jgi:catechol 2,3-dioxygenase-like lactoylglutathione lyase family enzyme